MATPSTIVLSFVALLDLFWCLVRLMMHCQTHAHHDVVVVDYVMVWTDWRSLAVNVFLKMTDLSVRLHAAQPPAQLPGRLGSSFSFMMSAIHSVGSSFSLLG